MRLYINNTAFLVLADFLCLCSVSSVYTHCVVVINVSLDDFVLDDVCSTLKKYRLNVESPCCL